MPPPPWFAPSPGGCSGVGLGADLWGTGREGWPCQAESPPAGVWLRPGRPWSQEGNSVTVEAAGLWGGQPKRLKRRQGPVSLPFEYHAQGVPAHVEPGKPGVSAIEKTVKVAGPRPSFMPDFPSQPETKPWAGAGSGAPAPPMLPGAPALLPLNCPGIQRLLNKRSLPSLFGTD